MWAGTGLDQLPDDLVSALQERVSNSVLLELVNRREQRWGERPAFLGPDAPLDTPPLTAAPAEAALSPAPDFSVLSPLGAGPALNI